MFFHKKPVHKPGCMTCHVIVAVLLLLASLVSLVGVVMAHYDPTDGTLVFGTASASLSLIAFGLTTTFFLKQLKCCMTACDVCAAPTPMIAKVMGKKK